MIISIENLRFGIEWWKKKKGSWGRDLANCEYYDIYDVRAGGINEEWWTATVERLWEWSAIRGSRPPNSKQEIAQRGSTLLPEIAARYGRISSLGTEPTVSDLPWDDVADLFNLASSIKSGSAVFASKIGHFLLPKAFTVVDNEATGLPKNYGVYWREMREEWLRFAEKNNARDLLIASIRPLVPLHPLYPVETKVIELSQIGHKHGRSAKGVGVG